MTIAAYASDTSLHTQIKIYFRNKYFYKSNTFNICMSDQTLEHSIWMLLKDSFPARFKSLYRRQAIGSDLILKLHSHTLACTQANRKVG